MTKTVLVTGATGFLGSSLAVGLLRSGYRVLCLGRSGGESIRKAVERASQTEGLALSADERERLLTGHWELGKADQIIPKEFAEVDLAWHCAAEMSYSKKRAFHSLTINAAGSVGLLRALKEHAPNCRRFHYVSTAYSPGLHKGPVPEKMVVPDHFLNGYQMSKSMTELSLAEESRGSGIALTVCRPSICVGHSKTGLYQGAPFGLYMFLESYRKVHLAGVKTVRMHLNPSALLNLLPVDHAVFDFLSLTARDQERLPECEVLNVVGDYVSIGRVMEATEASLGTRIVCGPPVTLIDQTYDKAVRANKEFAGHGYRFEVDKANRETGRERGLQMESSMLETVVFTYFRSRRDEPLTRCWKERIRFLFVSLYARLVPNEDPEPKPGNVFESSRRDQAVG